MSATKTMSYKQIFEMTPPPGLTHPLLKEKYDWVDSYLEFLCDEKEEKEIKEEVKKEIKEVKQRRTRAESDISDYEKEVSNVISQLNPEPKPNTTKPPLPPTPHPSQIVNYPPQPQLVYIYNPYCNVYVEERFNYYPVYLQPCIAMGYVQRTCYM